MERNRPLIRFGGDVPFLQEKFPQGGDGEYVAGAEFLLQGETFPDVLGIYQAVFDQEFSEDLVLETFLKIAKQIFLKSVIGLFFLFHAIEDYTRLGEGESNCPPVFRFAGTFFISFLEGDWGEN